MTVPNSKIWAVDKDAFIELVGNVSCVKEIFSHLGMWGSSSSYKTVRRRMDSLGLSYEDLVAKGKSSTRLCGTKARMPLDKLLVKASLVLNSSAKKRIIASGILGPEKCSKCGLGTEWQGEPITLQLDHINGDSKDHRRENLRILCPNCHTQTDTWGTKSKKKIYHCPDCSKTIGKQSKFCGSCAAKKRYRPLKIDWPPTAELRELLTKHSYREVGRMLGVTDNTIRKRLRNHPD